MDSTISREKGILTTNIMNMIGKCYMPDSLVYSSVKHRLEELPYIFITQMWVMLKASEGLASESEQFDKQFDKLIESSKAVNRGVQ